MIDDRSYANGEADAKSLASPSGRKKNKLLEAKSRDSIITGLYNAEEEKKICRDMSHKTVRTVFRRAMSNIEFEHSQRK